MKQSNYPVGDFLIRIKNVAMIGRKETSAGNTKLIQAVAETLKKLGYLDSIKINAGKITVSLSYHQKKPILYDLKLVSKPGMRVYKDVDEIKAVKGPFLLILSTNKGIISSDQAVKDRVGGEVLAKIW